MGHTRKGQQYFFGAKAHIGVDAESGLVHSTTTTAANVADITATANLLQGEEEAVFADAGYTGAEKREELKDLDVTWYIATKRGKIAALPEGEAKACSSRSSGSRRKSAAGSSTSFTSSRTAFTIANCVTKGSRRTVPSMRCSSPWPI
jgi:IS5 family transposase